MTDLTVAVARGHQAVPAQMPSNTVRRRSAQTSKARHYVPDPSAVPEGYEAQQGERGGWYYDTQQWDVPAEDPEKQRRAKFESLTLRSYNPFDFDVDALHKLDEALLEGLPDPPGETSWSPGFHRKPSAYRHAGQRIQDEVEKQRASNILHRLGNDPYLEEHANNRISWRKEAGLESTPEDIEEAKRQTVDSWLGAWTWSASENAEGRVIQRAIEQAFGIKGAEPWRGIRLPESAYGPPEEQRRKQEALNVTTDELWAKDGAFAQRLVKAMYDETQEFLASHGITEVPLMRGLGIADEQGQVPAFDIDYDEDTPGHNVELDCLAGSCFTTSFDTANTYSVTVDHGATMFVKVPASRILSTFRTGFGQMKESEVVVIGGPLEGVVCPAKGREEVMPGTHYTKNNEDALKWAKEAGMRRSDLEMYVPADRNDW